MIVAGAFTVFVLGLRHGADPDHLAAIDNVTRSAYPRTPFLSRFVGTMFAGGHTIMVLAISALVGLVGTRFAAHGAAIETAGTCVSIAVLVAIAIANVRQLRAGADRVTGAKLRLLPRTLREGTNALLAIPIGFLFGFRFRDVESNRDLCGRIRQRCRSPRRGVGRHDVLARNDLHRHARLAAGTSADLVPRAESSGADARLDRVGDRTRACGRGV
jgi:hypothetical protein